MGHAVPQPSEMFSDATGADVARRFEQYKGVLSAEHAKAAQGGRAFVPEQGIVEDPYAKSRAIAERVDNITKSVGPDVLASVQGEIDALKNTLGADIAKDWSLPGTAPNNATLTPYDLEAPAKLLVPRLTPLRNTLPRGKGQGSARQFRRILGWSNAGIGGVADKSPFFNSQSDPGPTFGSLALRRGPKIEYASDNRSAAYVEMGLSDQVNWVAQFAGQGFQDIRSLSQTALLWAHLGGEERAMLYGRGASGNGYAGAVSAPVISSSTATTGGTIAAGTYAVVVTARTGFGESVISNNTAQVTTGSTSTITVNVTTEPAGSLGVYNLYVSAPGGAVGTARLQTTFTGNTYTLTTAPTTTGAVNPGAVDSSVQTLGYDGFLTVQSGAESGYFRRLNAALGTTDPGDEFQVAFLSLYQSVKADPDHIWIDGATAKKLGSLLKTASSSSYQLKLDGDGHGHFLGAVVTGIENQVTRKMVPLRVHPWMPQGCALIRSETLPVPDSHVNATAEVISVQEYMSVDWPVIQMTYDSSTYWYGTLVHYAPAWSGLITSIL
jgi:hypothetical protein